MWEKAVYFIHVNRGFGYVSQLVWGCLQEEGVLQEETDMIFDGNPVMPYEDQAGNPFYFAACDVSAMVTWYEGQHAPERVLAVEKNRKELGLGLSCGSRSHLPVRGA